MVVLSPQAQAPTSPEAPLEALALVRLRAGTLIAPISGGDLKRSDSRLLMCLLVWDLGPIFAGL